MRTIEWKNGIVTTIDQTKLPTEVLLLKISSCKELAEAIKTMQIRGAPLLGAAAAYGLALTAYHSGASHKEQLLKELNASAQLLKQTRPTAVNLFWSIDRILKRATKTVGNVETVAQTVVAEAEKIAAEDVEMNRKIGEHGSSLLNEGDTILTHCNAGSLATVDYGTALGVIRTAWKSGKEIKVVATETRPLLQGARLTTYELLRDGIPVTLITDSMVGYIMEKKMVDNVVVGADRIVKDAVVNKIGTYAIAVLAHTHNIPFYVAAPKSTFDLNRMAKDVVIEERKAEEVTQFAGVKTTPRNVAVFNPAFDMTPLKYVTAIICEVGVLSPRTSSMHTLRAHDYFP
ncbi:MAG: S-methyl-5-thioribose-1-phosphate isomerase [Candidatus Bathyarchaeota archaeon]|nr:MAG: S-methyl-5-thioribose-1-phosphate isomerase [Candidatus Bathyarchaeota archaeon]